MEKDIIPIAQVEKRIYVVRGKRVMLDSDMAALYGVTTKHLNEQVSRNAERFPEDFAFKLTKQERADSQVTYPRPCRTEDSKGRPENGCPVRWAIHQT